MSDNFLKELLVKMDENVSSLSTLQREQSVSIRQLERDMMDLKSTLGFQKKKVYWHSWEPCLQVGRLHQGR